VTGGELKAAAALLAEIRARGFELRLRPDGRCIVHPREGLEDEVVDRLRSMREPLTIILEGAAHEPLPCVRCGKFAFLLPTVCYWCRRTEKILPL